MTTNAAAVPDLTPTEQTTPESYLGYVRLDPTRYVGAAVDHEPGEDLSAGRVGAAERSSPTPATGASSAANRRRDEARR